MYIGILDYQPIIDTILEKAVDMETGEITDEELLEQVNALEMERLDKVENIALEYKNNCYMVDAIDQEIAKLQLRKKEMQEKNEKINKLLGLLLDYEKFETAKVKLSFRKSSSVELVNETAIPEKFKTRSLEININDVPEELRNKAIKENTKISKTEIGKELKAGNHVEGAVLITKKNLQVK